MNATKLKITTNSLPKSRIAIEVEVPSERCKSSYDEAINRLSRSVKVPGFRKGKVPKAVILQQIGVSRIQASALETLLQRVWNEVIEEEKIEPLCEPEINGGFESLLENFNPDKSFIVSLETDIPPTPTLKTTKGLTAETEPVKFDPTQVDELIEQSRKQLATLIPIEDRPAAMGDIAVVNFQGNFEDDGSEIKGGKGESMDIELEKGRMIPGFIEGIIGMKINEKKELNCQFPEEYHQEDAKGRKANFKVELKEIKARELPEINDEFAKQASDKESIVELRDDLEEKLKEDAKRKNKKNRQESLLNSLVEQLEVEIPKSLIDQEVRNIVEQTAQNFAQQGIDVKSMFTPELVKSLMESAEPEAETNLRQKLALNALAKAENIELSEAEVNEKMKEVKLELSKEKNIDSKRLEEAIRDDLLQEKLYSWLDENNTIIEKSTIQEEKSNTQKIKKANMEEPSKKNAKKTEKNSSKKPNS